MSKCICAVTYVALVLCFIIPQEKALAQSIYTPFTFKTVVGLPPSLGNADGTNSAAQFRYPNDVAMDSAGNLYIADTGNDIIRKATPVGSNWVVTTLAGYSGTPGTADGVWTNARFNSPLGVAVDSAGNIYVADTYNHTIRKLMLVGTNWLVSTLAGRGGIPGSADGIGTNAYFNQPSGIGLDRSTNIYVADANNDTIREMTPTGGSWVVSTLAGQAGVTGSSDNIGTNAFFDNPTAIAVDGLTNLYVADTYNSLIRKITLSGTNWNVSTLAGNASFSYPGGVAVDGAGTVYVADSDNNTIRRIMLAGGNLVVDTLAGQSSLYGASKDGTNTAALFSIPEGLAVDASGNIFVADSYNHSIRKITPSGTNWVVTTAAGISGSNDGADGTNSGGHFNEPYGLAADAAGNIYVADLFDETIREIVPNGSNWGVTTIAGAVRSPGFANGPGGSSRFYYPNGIVADTAGNLYVADSFNNLIRKLTPAGTNWVVSTLGLSDSLNDPNGLAIDSATNLYVADTGNNVIRKLTQNGASWKVTTAAGSILVQGAADGLGGVARFTRPKGIARDASGNLYVADTSNDTIRKMTPIGTNWMVTTLAGLARNPGFADGANTNARFNQPLGIALDSVGNIYVADTYNNTIRKMKPSGTNWIITTLAGLPGNFGVTDGTGAAALFYHPFGIIVDANGNLLVADAYNNTIRKGTSAAYFLLNSVNAGSSTFNCSLAGPANQNVVIQVSSNLVDWQGIATNAFNSNGILNFSDSQITAFSNRFYRASLAQ